VPHVHVHIIPRKSTDFNSNNDEIYPRLERSEHDLNDDLRRLKGQLPIPNGGGGGGGVNGDSPRPVMQVPQDEDRKPRSEEEMQSEADWLASFF
jgi:bis(5'-adenosyl)-triphosphatase